jgi:hypothetical protein
LAGNLFALIGFLFTAAAAIFGLMVKHSLNKADKIIEQRKVDEILKGVSNDVKDDSDSELAARFNKDISAKPTDK